MRAALTALMCSPPEILVCPIRTCRALHAELLNHQELVDVSHIHVMYTAQNSQRTRPVVA